MVFVPETEPSRAYIPKAKSYLENKTMAGSNQKNGDVARFTLRRVDVLRREADESERVSALTLVETHISLRPLRSHYFHTFSAGIAFFDDAPLL